MSHYQYHGDDAFYQPYIKNNSSYAQYPHYNTNHNNYANTRSSNTQLKPTTSTQGSYKELLEKLQKEVEMLRNKNEGLKKENLEISQKYNEVSQLNQRMIEKEKENSKVQQDQEFHLTRLLDENKEKNRQIHLLSEENQGLTTKLIDCNNLLLDLGEKHNELKENHNALRTKFLKIARPIQVDHGDCNEIANSVRDIISNIGKVIEKIRGPDSSNLDKMVAIEQCKYFNILPESGISDTVNLDLCMEGVIMRVLIELFFKRKFECFLDDANSYMNIYYLVYNQNPTLAMRWRQQICASLSAEHQYMSERKEKQVGKAIDAIKQVLSKAYPSGKLPSRVKTLCSRAFDLALTMMSVESMYSYIEPPLGIQFDNETMETFPDSNTNGIISLVIFPGFEDEEKKFRIKPWVWCR
jgi:hypothetical protein